MSKRRSTLRGVVFDMDGTLTIPNLDFGEMYRRCGVDPKDDILRVLSAMSEVEARPKHDIIEEMEDEATRTMQLMPGASEMVHWLAVHGIPTALVTRNTNKSAQALQTKLSHSFDVIVARDTHAELPPKPDPAAMKFICSSVWNNLDPSSVVMVGDSPANDIVFGRKAGAHTALLDSGRKHFDADKTTDMTADIVVDHLHFLPHELWKYFDIDSEFGTNVPLLKYDAPVMESATEDIPESVQLAPDTSGNTPLIWAADAGDLETVQRLLPHSSKEALNVQGYLGATAVCRAARRGHVRILELLLQAGANPNIPNMKHQYPLHFAAFKDNMDAVQMLLQFGANTRVLDRKGRIPAQDTKNEAIRNYILDMM